MGLTSLSIGRSQQAWRSRPVRRARRRTRFAQVQLRTVTARYRMLPDFLIIGTMRGGTSSLYKYLGVHPDVSASIRKETEFFSRYYDRGLDWYQAHFPLARDGARFRSRRMTFEATPYYLLHPLVPERAADALPNCKIVVMLRDPATRAWSHHAHLTRLGFESLPFEQAIAAEAGRLGGEEKRMIDDPSYFSVQHHRFSYLIRGRYAEQIERWLQFFPRDSFLFIDSSSFFREPSAIYGEILSFLQLPDYEPASFSNWSTLGVPGGGGMPSTLRAEVNSQFADDNERLWDLIGERFPW